MVNITFTVQQVRALFDIICKAQIIGEDAEFVAELKRIIRTAPVQEESCGQN